MEWIRGLRSLLDVQSTVKWFLLPALVGIVAGIGAILFQFASDAVTHFALVEFAGYTPGEPAGEAPRFESRPKPFSPWRLIVVLAAGGLISGTLVFTFAPEAEGHGTDAAIEAFHHKRGFIRSRIPLIKMIASAVTIGTGGSGGREGPIAQIGAGFGSFLATRLQLPARDRRILLAAGMGAGVGAIFRAPLAGALFAAEVLYRDADLESDVIVPAAIASIIGYSVFSLSLPSGKRFTPLFGDQLEYSFDSFWQLVPLSVLAFVLVAVGVVYIKTFYGTHRLFKKIPVARQVRPALGAVLSGLLGLLIYSFSGSDTRVLAVLSTGYSALQSAVEETRHLGIPLLLTIAAAKILTTSMTIGSGGSGGVFGPSMVIGGCVGGAVGLIFQNLLPAWNLTPEIFAIVGMSGFFSGCARTPISTIIMVSEMTGDYKLLIPSMWVSTLCFVLGRRWTLYEKQLPSRLESPAHRGDFLIDILEGIKVGDVKLAERRHVLESSSLREIIGLLPETRQNYFPVLDEHGQFAGIFSTDDVRSYLYDKSLWELVNARDIMTTRLITVTPADDLNTAMRRFTERNLDELPVVSVTNSSRNLLGMLRRKDAIAVYNQRLTEQRERIAETQ